MEYSKTLLEAISRRLRVSAVYNRTNVVLAPHILYTRHGELHVDAVTLERDGAPPKQVKLGTFRLSGLGDARLLERGFEPDTSFDPADQRYAGVTLFAI